MEIIPRTYHPAQDATYGASPHRPLLNTPTYDDAEHWCLTVQPFRAGGYEATLRPVDLQKAADLAAMPRRRGKRTPPEERTQGSIESSRQRAKATVRKRVKDMGGNRLCTLTARQSDAVGYMTPEEWAAAFARFVRLMRRAGLMADYVAILEPHKKGLERLRERERTDGSASDARPHPATESAWDIPLHIHFVTRSEFKMPINLMRKCWGVALGERDGNIDVQWLRASKFGDDIDRVAAYATKYITKGLAEFERFNKKRYWAAGEALLPKGRTWLRGRTQMDAWAEMRERLQLDDAAMGFLIANRLIFVFPGEGQGCWLNIRPLPRAAPPPF